MNGSEIAVVGMACRFPGARNLDEFWQNLRSGVESISFLTDDEIKPSLIDPGSPQDHNYVKAASILADADLFDADFFGYMPREAEVMDPQHRVFLECAWEAVEHAGYDPESYKRAVGVFAGARTNTYLFNLFSNSGRVGSLNAFEIGLGNDLAFLPARVSYKLNLTGPSYAIQTACSTSLIAVHLACQSLLIDECQMALAGGVAINVPQKTGYLYTHGGIASPDGHCRAFDAKAQGTLFGSGCGVVVLKRLEDAVSDGDTIHAIIKGSAVNNDGFSKAGFTAPSVRAQAAVIKEALAVADVDPETVSYVEAHGTGTAIGDPIEIQGLTKAFGQSAETKNFCAIGSVKTNLGHLDAAAGIAGFIKTVLALKHRMLPPSLHFEQPNPNIEFENSPFYVNTKLTDWKTNGQQRRAGVSAFGAGGANAHLILEEAPAVEESKDSKKHHLLVLSARSPAALDQATMRLAAYLRRYPDLNPADVAYTLQAGRRSFAHRRVLVCTDLTDAAPALESLDLQRTIYNAQESSNCPVVFMFPGGGAQYVNMGKGIYQAEPVFRAEVDRCCAILETRLGRDLRESFFPPAEKTAEVSERLERASVALPALFTVEYAMAKLLMSWGIQPGAMIGHSLGEYVAACLAGVFSLEDALALVVLRGRLFDTLPEGAMLSVSISENETLSLISEPLSIAAINGPTQCVVSGPAGAIEEFAGLLDTRGIEFRRLHIDVAAHSDMVTPILAEFREFIEKVELHAPALAFISNVTGGWITAEQAVDPAYWTTHLRQTVRFADGMRELMKDPARALLEVGPGQTLSTLAKLQDDSIRSRVVLSTIRHPYEPQPDDAFLLSALGRMWLSGIEVDWARVHATERRLRVPLPTYPFERRRYWIEPINADDRANSLSSSGKKSDLADWFYAPVWKSTAPAPKFRPRNAAPRRWLTLAPGDDPSNRLSDRLSDRLAATGHDVIRVLAGAGYGKISEGVYTINPGRRKDYDALLGELRESDKLPTDIAHLWSITPDDDGLSETERFKKAQETGYYSLLYLAQAVAAQRITDTLRLWVITNGLYEIESGDRLNAEKATMLGPCKVIPQEYRNIASHCVDIVVTQTGTLDGSRVRDRLIDQLAAEFEAPSPGAVVAYRGARRWTQSFEPVRLPGEVKERCPLREKGVYLITGGLGGVGLLLGQYLARTLKAKLALISRSLLPDRSLWETWLATHDEADSTSAKIRKIMTMEEAGGEIMIAHTDVANPEQVETLIAEIYTRFGRLDGVIHAAGVTSGPSVFTPIDEIGPVESELQFQPKAYGLYTLEKALRDREVDFCLLTSSNSSVLGGMGFVAYAAANAFMDAFACASNRANSGNHGNNGNHGGTSWLSVSWDPWPEETKKYEGMQTSMDVYTMTEAESVEAFHRAVSISAGSGAESHLIVATGDLPARLRLWLDQDETANGASDSRAYPRPVIHNAYVAPGNETERRIAELWRQFLGIEQIGIYDNFFGLGGHSLLATRLVAQLREVFNLDFPLQKFFESPTIAGLALAVSNLRDEQENLERDAILNMLDQLSEEEIAAEIGKRK